MQFSCVPTPIRYSWLLAYTRHRTYADFGILTSCVHKNGILDFMRKQNGILGPCVCRTEAHIEIRQSEVRRCKMIGNMLVNIFQHFIRESVLGRGLDFRSELLELLR